MRRARQLTLYDLLGAAKTTTAKPKAVVPRVDKKALLIGQLTALQFPSWQTEFRFHGEREWRFDVCWPERKLACEVEGGLYVQGRHSRGQGAENDMQKYGEAFALGWRVLRVSPRLIKSGAAVRWLEIALRGAA